MSRYINNTLSPRGTKNFASKILGEPEIIARVEVRKYIQKKCVIVPIGVKLNVRIQEVSGVGIGVTTVCESSMFYDKIIRGDIFSEFMGLRLKDVSIKQFVSMLNRQDVSMYSRNLVIEYTAANAGRLFKFVREPDSHSKRKNDEGTDTQSKSVSNDNSSSSLHQTKRRKIVSDQNDNVDRIGDTVTTSSSLKTNKDTKFLHEQTSLQNEKSRNKTALVMSSKKDDDPLAVFENIQNLKKANEEVQESRSSKVAENSGMEEYRDIVEHLSEANNTNSLRTTKDALRKMSETPKSSNSSGDSNSNLEQDSMHATLSNDSFNDWLADRKKEWKKQREAGDNCIAKLLSNTSNEQVSDRKSAWNKEDRVKNASNNKHPKKTNDPTSYSNENGNKFSYVSAKDFGLPDGWTVRIQPRSRYTFRSPSGRLFYSKKSVFEFLAVDTEKSFLTTASNKGKECNEPSRSGANEGNSNVLSVSSEIATSTELVRNNYGNPMRKNVIHETLETETSNEDQTSLADVVEKLKAAREKVRQFGPIPWEGCTIVKVPPAPAKLGIQIQSIPSKFGAGIVNVDVNSPLYSQVRRGDIITHFMSEPLHGLSVDELLRLINAENKRDRVLQVAPSNYNFNDQSRIKLPASDVDAGKSIEVNTTNMPEQATSDKLHTTVSNTSLADANSSRTQSNFMKNNIIYIGKAAQESHGEVMTGQNTPTILLDKRNGFSANPNHNTLQYPSKISCVNENNLKIGTSETIPVYPKNNTIASLVNASIHESLKNTNLINLDQRKDVLQHKERNNHGIVQPENVTLVHQSATECSANFTRTNVRDTKTNSFSDQNTIQQGQQMQNTQLAAEICLHKPSVSKELHQSGQNNPITSTLAKSQNFEKPQEISTNNIQQIQVQTQQCTSNEPQKLSALVTATSRTEAGLLDFRKWSKEEDELLRSTVEKYGTEDWDRVALEIPLKTATRCRFRWIDIIQAENRNGTIDQHLETGTNKGTNESQRDHFKKVLLSPFNGSLGINVQQLPSKNGIGVVSVASTSPLFGKLHRGDVILQFMGNSLKDIGVQEFIQMVNEKKDEHRSFMVSSTPQTQTTYLPETNLDDEGEEGDSPKIFKVTVEDISEYEQSEIEQMPICFAFDPKSSVSKAIAENKQKRCLFQSNGLKQGTKIGALSQ